MRQNRRWALLVCVLAGLTLLTACSRRLTTPDGSSPSDTSVTETAGDAAAQIADLTERMNQAAEEGDAEAAEAYANQILALDSENEAAQQVLRDLNAVAGSSMK